MTTDAIRNLNPDDPLTLPLLPVLVHHQRDTQGVEERLATAARAAKTGETPVRNALYFAFEPRLLRIAATIWRRHGRTAGIDWEDVRQEAFLVFTSVLEGWDGLRPLIPYVIGVFPWRMRDAVDQLGDRPPSSSPGRSATGLHPLDSFLDEEALRLLETLAGELPLWHRRVLVLRVRDGMTEREIARSLGLARRTVQRVWRESLTLIGPALIREGDDAS